MLRNFWYPLFFSASLPSDRPVGVELFGEPLVLFRDKEGVAHCLADRCAHRSVPLSLGRICDGKIECMYHGWRFGGQGLCEHIPTHAEGEPIPKTARVPRRATIERDGLVWVFANDAVLADDSQIPSYKELVSPDFVVADGAMDLDVDYSLLLENLVDASHVPFVHRGTLATPDLAQPLIADVQAMPDGGFRGVFQSTRIPKLPLPDFFAFEPPCHVRAGRFDKSIVRLFHCVPLAKGRVRFLWWIAFNYAALDSNTQKLLDHPEQKQVWLKKVIDSQNQIYSEDLAMLQAQQLRIAQNAPAFGCPVKIDGLALQCRKWREQNEGPDTWFDGYQTKRVTASNGNHRSLDEVISH